MTRHFLELADYSAEELSAILDLAAELKALYAAGQRRCILDGKTVILLFEKPSSRTRISFEVGINQLGGSSIYVKPEDIGGLGKREPIKDLARVLDGYVDMIVARTFSHDSIVEITQYTDKPVINALSDKAHPCQVMADMLTIREVFGRLSDIKLTYVGDSNNMAYSLAVAARRLGLHFTIACPADYSFDTSIRTAIDAVTGPGTVTYTTHAAKAVAGADVVYTDTWTSMGQESEKAQRIAAFGAYQLNAELLAGAPGARIMHCLPAYRDLEITDEVIESPNSIVFHQAENRLHAQRAVMATLMTP